MNELIQFLRSLWKDTITPTIEAINRKNKENSENIQRAILSLQKDDISINNPDDISAPIVESQSEARNALVEAIRAIPKVEVPEVDLKLVESKLDALKETLEKKDMSVNIGKTKVEVDTKSIVKAIEKASKETPEMIDYTLMFDEMMKMIEKDRYGKNLEDISFVLSGLAKSADIEVIAKWLEVIALKEIDIPEFKFDDEGRLLVAVDKIGGGGGGGLTSIQETVLTNIEGNTDGIETKLDTLNSVDFSTEAKQDDIITKLTSIDGKDFSTESSLILAIAELQETNTNLLNAITAINRRKTNPDDNKTTTPLAGGATWTGEWIDTREYVQCVVSIITDQNSATDGLVIEQSTDGVTANMHPHKTTVNVNSPDGHHYTTTIEGNYIRVKYTNGAVAQSSFKLFITAFSTPSEEGHVHAVEYEITGDHPAQVVRSVLVAKRPDGTYENIQATQGGNLKFSLEELESGISSNNNSQLNVTRFDSSGNEVIGRSYISTVNSSTTPLGIGGVFTGTAEEISQYSTVSVSILTDRNSATDGCSVQFSQDGTNWDFPQPHTVTANVPHNLIFPAYCRYFRIVYTNGGVAQTFFRLQTKFKHVYTGGHVERVDGDVDDATIVQNVRSILAAKKPDGSYINIDATAGGNLKVAIEEFETAVAEMINQYPGGTGANGTVTLTNANTAYAVNSPPSGSYTLTVYNGSASDAYWGYATLTTGGILLPSGGTLTLNLGASQTIYLYSATAGIVINYSQKLVS